MVLKSKLRTQLSSLSEDGKKIIYLDNMYFNQQYFKALMFCVIKTNYIANFDNVNPYQINYYVLADSIFTMFTVF